ncbi:hypothetical protein SUGI_0219060 [Cryptomeria japonica]|nr:hypothetical protein SUGI_0219060 [Cryptomeria japonica]
MANSDSPSDMDPSGLTYFDYELNIPSQNILPISLRFHALADLLLDNNSLTSIVHEICSLWNISVLQAPAEDNGGRLELFVATSEHVQHPDFVDFVSATNASRLFVLHSNQFVFPHELPLRTWRFSVGYEVTGTSYFKFKLYKIDDGAISESEIAYIFSQDLMQTHNFGFFEGIMRLEGKIRLLVGTPDQLSNPLVIDGIRNYHKKLRTYTYNGQYRESNSGISDEEAAQILGSPTWWSEGLEEGADDDEVICAICLDSIERGVEVKALECKHVYHYACILRSTKRKAQCPLCRASYDYRTGQSE